MSTEMKRFMISLTPDLEEKAETLKQKEFYNKSYAELYRYLIHLGLEAAQADSKSQH